MADGQDMRARHARIDRRDAALVAEYIHALSERHGSEATQAARSAGAGTAGTAASGTGRATSAGASRATAAARASARARHRAAWS
jgi:hypothetical protein